MTEAVAASNALCFAHLNGLRLTIGPHCTGVEGFRLEEVLAELGEKTGSYEDRYLSVFLCTLCFTQNILMYMFVHWCKCL